MDETSTSYRLPMLLKMVKLNADVVDTPRCAIVSENGISSPAS
jgi:hypothetical protein